MHEKDNRLAIFNNRLKRMNNWLNRVTKLEEKLNNAKINLENLKIIYDNSACRYFETNQLTLKNCEKCTSLQNKIHHYLIQTLVEKHRLSFQWEKLILKLYLEFCFY